MSSQAIFTLYEGHYHYGVAALLNSALAAGFTGRFFVGYREHLPPWTKSLQRETELEYSIQGTRITFFQDATERHFGFQKPFAALWLFERYPEISTLYYADPDVTFLAPWNFFEDWAGQGVGLVGDVNFREVSANHPWRCGWRTLLAKAGYSDKQSTSLCYPNSGFLALNRIHRELLEIWEEVTKAYEQSGGSTSAFQMRERWRAVVSDQDLLAAAILAWSGPVSMLGPEAMGFTGYFFILSHAIESPKPWVHRSLRRALRGFPPTQFAKHFLSFANSPIRVESDARAFLRKAGFVAAQLLSHFYRRSA